MWQIYIVNIIARFESRMTAAHDEFFLFIFWMNYALRTTPDRYGIVNIAFYNVFDTSQYCTYIQICRCQHFIRPIYSVIFSKQAANIAD